MHPRPYMTTSHPPITISDTGCGSTNLVSLPVGVQVDMYSFGVILWELITTEVPRRGRLRAIKASTVPCMQHTCYHASVEQACHWYTATTQCVLRF